MEPEGLMMEKPEKEKVRAAGEPKKHADEGKESGRGTRYGEALKR